MEGWFGSVRNVWPLKRFLNEDNPVKQETVDLPGHKFTAALEPWESYMMTTQSLLIWEKPSRSVIALVAVNVIFWLIVWSEPKVYFVLGSVGLAIFLHQQWVHCIWPEIRVPLQPGERHKDYTDEWLHLNPSVMQAPEVGVLLEDWFSAMQSWLTSCLYYRRHRPTLFCLSSSAVFVLLLLAGQLVSGTALLYGVLMGLMLLPGASRYALPAFRAKGATLFSALAEMFMKGWNALAARAGPTFSRTGGDGGDSSPDDLSEFLPDSATEEAEAALAVPLLAADPPEVVAALERVQQQQDRYDEDLKPPPQALRSVTAPQPDLNPSPYNSLTPHIPPHSVPSVSDSSDEEEQEFMQGLVFDSIRREQHSSLAVRPPDGVGHHPDLSLNNFSQEESLGYDQLDLDSAAMSRYGGSGGQYGGYPATEAPMSTAAAMQSLASTFLQQPSMGGGALLSSIGQSMLSSVMANMAPLAAPQPTRTSSSRVPRHRPELSDDEEGSYGQNSATGYSDSPALVSEGIDGQGAQSERTTTQRSRASGVASRGHATSSLARRRRQPARRSARRAAVSMAAAARGGDTEEVSSGSALDDAYDDDFEIISDEEFSE